MTETKLRKQLHLIKTILLCLELGLNKNRFSEFKLAADMVVLNEYAA